LAHIPVLLLTGAFEAIDPQKAVDVGCDGVLAKPFEPALAVEKVKALLARGRGRSVELETNLGAPGSSTKIWSVPDERSPGLPAADAGKPDPRSLGDFFDRLDAAFANLPGAGRDPGPSQSIPPPAVASPRNSPVTDELVERVAARVLERLSREQVRDTVTDLVSTIAERLVREEIERIKASIR
jgi:CheY-like chemotaxis protein